VAISIGAILGANARYILGGWITDRFGAGFPLGTLVINVSGSVIIGFFLTLIGERIVVDDLWRLLIAVGFLGGYTTFSTFSYETLALIQAGSWDLAAVNIVASVSLSMIGVFLGAVVARAI
jgi:CrcB protein